MILPSVSSVVRFEKKIICDLLIAKDISVHNSSRFRVFQKSNQAYPYPHKVTQKYTYGHTKAINLNRIQRDFSS